MFNDFNHISCLFVILKVIVQLARTLDGVLITAMTGNQCNIKWFASKSTRCTLILYLYGPRKINRKLDGRPQATKWATSRANQSTKKQGRTNVQRRGEEMDLVKGTPQRKVATMAMGGVM